MYNRCVYCNNRYNFCPCKKKENLLYIVFDNGGFNNFDGIIAYASDPAAPTAAYVSEKLGLPTNPYVSVNILCNKDKFRKFLSENGFNSPMARGYADVDTAIGDISDFRFPVIIKPVDSSGSKGATVLHISDKIK